MTTSSVQVRRPDTGAVVRVCRGPTAAGGCPLAGADGVVPCAGLLIAPPHADPRFWPLVVPHGYRHCDLPWHERATAGLQAAERYRRRWQAGLDRENRRVERLAAARDPRYRRMSPRELRSTALWRWRLTAGAQALRRSEEKSQKQAETYLTFLRFRRTAASGP